jgi:hypothetical protein
VLRQQQHGILAWQQEVQVQPIGGSGLHKPAALTCVLQASVFISFYQQHAATPWAIASLHAVHTPLLQVLVPQPAGSTSSLTAVQNAQQPATQQKQPSSTVLTSTGQRDHAEHTKSAAPAAAGKPGRKSSTQQEQQHELHHHHQQQQQQHQPRSKPRIPGRYIADAAPDSAAAAGNNCKQPVLQPGISERPVAVHAVATSNARCGAKLDKKSVAFALESIEGAVNSQSALLRPADGAAQAAPSAAAPAASNVEHKRSSYVLQFQSSSANTFNKPAAAAFGTQQRQLGAPAPTVMDAGCVDGEQQQLPDEALSPDGPDSPQLGQALLDAGWTYHEEQQQQVMPHQGLLMCYSSDQLL